MSAYKSEQDCVYQLWLLELMTWSNYVHSQMRFRISSCSLASLQLITFILKLWRRQVQQYLCQLKHSCCLNKLQIWRVQFIIHQLISVMQHKDLQYIIAKTLRWNAYLYQFCWGPLSFSGHIVHVEHEVHGHSYWLSRTQDYILFNWHGAKQDAEHVLQLHCWRGIKLNSHHVATCKNALPRSNC